MFRTMINWRSLQRNIYIVVMIIMVLPVAAVAGEATLGEAEYYAPGIQLPAGDGLGLLQRACTRCHDLTGLPAYKGYWNRDRWRSMVQTMVANGAQLGESEIVILTDYLVEHFGPEKR